MPTNLTWLGHGSWLIETAEQRVLLDPFLNDSPTAPCKADDVEADFILVSHGHFDHVADVASIANRTGATVVAIYEISEWFAQQHQVENTIGMNLGTEKSAPRFVSAMPFSAPMTHPNMITCPNAARIIMNSHQKSVAPSADRPMLRYMISAAPVVDMVPRTITLTRRLKPKPSSRNAIAG